MKNINVFKWAVCIFLLTVVMSTISSCISGNKLTNNRTVMVKSRGVHVLRTNRNSVKLRMLRIYIYR